MKPLNQIANEIRRQILISLNAAGSGHLGGSLGLADVFTCLYFDFLNHKPDNPQWQQRDKLVLSIGHVAPVLYASLTQAGYFPKEELLSLRKFGSRLQGHPALSHNVPGLETSSGSLGQGLSIAVGMGLSDKLDGVSSRKIVSIHGDGELQEGSIWEAAMSASHHKLNQLIAIVDRNGLQIDGNTETVMSLEPLTSKWESFGWHVQLCNGNNITEIQNCLAETQRQNKPSVIIAKTKMGCGVPSIENNCQWHGKAPNDEELECFLKELDAC